MKSCAKLMLFSIVLAGCDQGGVQQREIPKERPAGVSSVNSGGSGNAPAPNKKGVGDKAEQAAPAS